MQHSLGFLALVLGGAVVGAFLLDLVGLEVRPWTVGPVVLALLALTGWNFWRQVRRGKYAWGGYHPGEFALFLAVGLGFLAYAIWLGRPNLLPVGTTVDAVHQYGLADYITQSGHLPIHATDQRANLQDGLAYPPAFVTIVALLAPITGFDPIYLLYPLAAFCAALSACLTFAITSFLLREKPWRLPLAGLAAGLTFVPYGYTFGSFTFQNYFAQVFGQALLLLALFFLVDWQRHHDPVTVGFFGLTVAALIICYPTFALIPLAAFGLLALFWSGQSWRKRLIYLGAVFGPLIILAILFLKDRLETGLGTVANEGEVLLPDLGRYGWPVVVVATVGLALALWRGQAGARLVGLYAGLVALEGLGLWLLKTFFNQGSYYAVYKLFYPAAYLFPLLAVIGLDWIFGAVFKSRPRPPAKFWSIRRVELVGAGLGIGLYGLFLVGTWIAHPNPERPFAVITRDEVNVARWMKSHLKIDEYNVSYNVLPGTPAYWLQVGIFKQPRGVHSNDLLNRIPLTFESWFYGYDSTPYLFTGDLPRINLDERTQVLYQSGSAAVLTRTPAYDQESGLRPGLTLQYKSDLKNGYLELRTEATMTAEPSSWLRLGLEVEPAGGGSALYSTAVPAEPGREKKQFMGIVLGIPNLKISEFYSNQATLQPPAQPAKPLAPGQYAAFMILYKQDAVLVKHKLFEFNQPPGVIPIPDFGKGVAFGQYLYEGSLPQTLPAIPLVDFSLDEAQFRLKGLDLPEKGPAGATIQAAIQMQAIAPVSHSYKLRWLWLDQAGQEVARTEAEPLNGLYPTWLWPAGQPTTLRQGLKLPTKPGRYQLALALVNEAGTVSELKPLAKFVEVS